MSKKGEDKKGCAAANDVRLPQNVAYHRAADVRKLQGTSWRAIAGALDVSVEQARAMLKPDYDLKLSELHQLAKVMAVPLAELLVEDGGGLSPSVAPRAKLVLIGKTVLSILENASSPAIRRLAQTLYSQFLEMFPELPQLTPWHAVGKRRTQDELGAAWDRRLSDDANCSEHPDDY